MRQAFQLDAFIVEIEAELALTKIMKSSPSFYFLLILWKGQYIEP